MVELTNKLTIGDPPTATTAWSSSGCLDKITKYIEIGKEEGELLAGGTADDSRAISSTRPSLPSMIPRLAHARGDLGPAVALIKAKDFDQAIDIANNTDYGLTGAVITTNRFNQEKARRDFHVGNLYFNRGCTGAIVGYQPFGGFNLSGTDSKAGGPDYLVLHMQAKTTSEQF